MLTWAIAIERSSRAIALFYARPPRRGFNHRLRTRMRCARARHYPCASPRCCSRVGHGGHTPSCMTLSESLKFVVVLEPHPVGRAYL